MQTFKKSSNIIFVLLVILSFSKCSTAKKLQDSIPFEVGQVYFQQLINEGTSKNSEIKVFIPVASKPDNIILDSVFFRGQQSKLETNDDMLHVARFDSPEIQKKDIIMSGDPLAEYGNEVPLLPRKTRFKLKSNACVISYKQGNTIKYYKISNIIEK